jgi:integrase
MPAEKLYLFKKANGYYYVQFELDGQRRQKSTREKTKTEALKFLTDFRENVKKRHTRLLFSEFVQQFCKLRAPALRPTTLKRIYLPAFKSFQSVCGDRYLSAYTLRDVEKFKAARYETCTSTSVNIEFRTLRAAFNCAVAWGYLRENPFSKSRPIAVPEQPPAYLSKEEFQRLINIVDVPVLRELFIFAALTGLRQGEILNLEWSHVDFDQRLIYVANSEWFVTKSGKCRVVPMSDTVFSLLEGRGISKSFCRYVFHSGGTKLSQSYVEHKFKHHVRRLGLNDRVKFHSLRHSFATWLAREGVSIYEIQKLLGHSDVRVTQVYAQLATAELHNAVNKLKIAQN